MYLYKVQYSSDEQKYIRWYKYLNMLNLIKWSKEHYKQSYLVIFYDGNEVIQTTCKPTYFYSNTLHYCKNVGWLCQKWIYILLDKL